MILLLSNDTSNKNDVKNKYNSTASDFIMYM